MRGKGGKQSGTFLCKNCGDTFPQWFGRCPSCGEWNTLVLYREPGRSQSGRQRRPVGERLGIPGRSAGGGRHGWLAGTPDGGFEAGIRRVGSIDGTGLSRMATGLTECDRVLGGGIVPGSVVLIGGDPGIGKSTLLLQVASEMSRRGHGVLYVSAEESAEQVRLRAGRIGVSEDLHVMAEADLERILEAVSEGLPAAGGEGRADLQVLVVDSIQSIYLADLPSAPGSVLQVRECALTLTRLAKTKGLAVFMIGHMTKEGAIAGPRVLEHLVDVVLSFEGDRFHAHRLLRAVKNRFGSVDEIGVFDMQDRGLVEVENPSRLFLGEKIGVVPGSVVFAGMEGSRGVLAEVQALVHPARFGTPQRIASGIDPRRLAIILAVLGKRAGIPVSESDVFVSVTGGLRVDEPAVDLAVALAVASSVRDRPVGGRTAVFGEVGLGGEIRRVGAASRRVAEAARLGFSRVIMPAASLRDMQGARSAGGADAVGVEDVAAAVRAGLAGPQAGEGD